MLDFEATLHLEEREKVIEQRIERYFEQQRYQAKQDHIRGLYYERGSAWGNYIAMNPGHWHVFASAMLHTTDDQSLTVEVRMNVDTQGQFVLARERQYWETEFDVLTAYLETGKSKHEDIVGDLGRRNYRQNMNLTLGSVIAFSIMIFVFFALLLAMPCTC